MGQPSKHRKKMLIAVGVLAVITVLSFVLA
jgi:hypothetical protein